jgi:SHS2 domain-containing protein
MNRQPGLWEHFAHEADIGIRGIGADMRTAFEQAALALTAVVTDPAAVRPAEKREFECEAPDEELLLVDWLNALIYSMGADFLLYSKFEVAIAAARQRVGRKTRCRPPPAGGGSERGDVHRAGGAAAGRRLVDRAMRRRRLK